MQFAYRWINRDLGKVEFIFAIIIISILLTSLVNKSLSLFASTERQLVEATVTNIQTALRLQTTIQSINKRTGNAIEITEGMNPVSLMQSSAVGFDNFVGSAVDFVKARQAAILPITNYLGEMYDPDIDTLERGNWYFDHSGNLFVYLVKNKEYFGEGSNAATELKYTVKLDYNDANNNQFYEAGIDILESASFVRIDSEKQFFPN